VRGERVSCRKLFNEAGGLKFIYGDNAVGGESAFFASSVARVFTLVDVID
jgi:hypothetical protein